MKAKKAGNYDQDSPDTDRPLPPIKDEILPVVESEEHLHNTKNEESRNQQGKDRNQKDEIGLEEKSGSFSIEDQRYEPQILEEEEEPGFSQLNSNIERPLN